MVSNVLPLCYQDRTVYARRPEEEDTTEEKGEERMMMGGMFFMMIWMVLGGFLFVALLVVLIWLLVRWLNTQHTPVGPPPRQHDTDYGYAEGYHPSQQPSEICQQRGRQYHAPQPKQENEQPQIEDPTEQQPPRAQKMDDVT